jgi:hypothetical protein
MVSHGLRDDAAALPALEQALRDRGGTMAWLGVEPQLAWLRASPRFQRLLQALKLPPEAREPRAPVFGGTS